MRLTRREFIRASAATAALLSAGCATTEPLSAAMAPRKPRGGAPAKGEWVASTCQGCTQWCAIQIFVEEGRAVRVRGNPLSKTNHGYVCPRGHMIPQQVYDPDRIKVPMKRTNPAKGRHRFVGSTLFGSECCIHARGQDCSWGNRVRADLMWTEFDGERLYPGHECCFCGTVASMHRS